jgi:hypothetical protein
MAAIDTIKRNPATRIAVHKTREFIHNSLGFYANGASVVLE